MLWFRSPSLLRSTSTPYLPELPSSQTPDLNKTSPCDELNSDIHHWIPWIHTLLKWQLIHFCKLVNPRLKKVLFDRSLIFPSNWASLRTGSFFFEQLHLPAFFSSFHFYRQRDTLWPLSLYPQKLLSFSSGLFLESIPFFPSTSLVHELKCQMSRLRMWEAMLSFTEACEKQCCHSQRLGMLQL